MPKKTRVRKSINLQVLVSWDSGKERFRVEDVIWPNEKPFESFTEHHVVEVDPARDFTEQDCLNLETFFALLQACDLHGSEEMRTAMKILLQIFVNDLVSIRI